VSQSGFSAADKGAEKPGNPRRISPAFERNIDPICAVLGKLLTSGTVLEIGSGPGQHIAEYRRRFPNLTWIASDPSADFRRSCNAWAEPDAPPAFNIDASQDWADDVSDLSPLRAVVCSNVIHISPIAVLKGIVAGAAKTLAPKGLLIFYGPFAENGVMAPSNADFDAKLRAENPDWGVRDLRDLNALATAFEPVGKLDMPANNLIVVYSLEP